MAHPILGLSEIFKKKKNTKFDLAHSIFNIFVQNLRTE